MVYELVDAIGKEDACKQQLPNFVMKCFTFPKANVGIVLQCHIPNTLFERVSAKVALLFASKVNCLRDLKLGKKKYVKIH